VHASSALAFLMSAEYSAPVAGVEKVDDDLATHLIFHALEASFAAQEFIELERLVVVDYFVMCEDEEKRGE